MSSSILSNLSRPTLIAASAGIAFVGYCIYFDRKRRSAPDFKRKLRERVFCVIDSQFVAGRAARAAASAKSSAGMGGGDDFATGFPSTPTEMQRFFTQELQLGEELLSTGQLEQGVRHMANAVVMCGQPQQILAIMKQTLPGELFELLLDELPRAKVVRSFIARFH